MASVIDSQRQDLQDGVLRWLPLASKEQRAFVLTTARWTLVVLDERLHLAHEAMGYGSIHRRFTHVPRMFRGTLRFASKVWLRL